MKKLNRLPLLLGLLALAFTSCQTEEEKTWNKFKDWRETNENWLTEQRLTGQYQRIVPEWNQDIYILIRYLNDRSKTEGNLTPLYTSQCAVKYKGMLYDGTAIDSTYTLTDSITTINPANVISGWLAALENMRVGDHAEVLIPYQAGYGSSEINEILPYSALKFDIELRGLYNYEVRP